MPNPVLVLFAHPAQHKSRVNVRLADAIQDLPSITLHNLYSAYPRFDIDVEREQALLSQHDIIVWQHPFFWYSTPAILKEWQDLVLEHGWAYGRRGKALVGKKLMCALSTGASEEAYHPQGHNRFTIRQFLAPAEQTALLCGMQFLPPFVVHATHRLSSAQIDDHAACYRQTLLALRDGRLDLSVIPPGDRINAHPSAIRE